MHMSPATPMRLVPLVAILLAAPVFAQPQTVLYPGQTGAPLLSAIDADYSPALTLGYNPARDSLYAYEQRTDGELCGVYTRFCIQLTPGADPSTDAFNKGINAEHTWPQSMGAADEPSRSDLHHLFPAKANVNSSRGNEPYGEIADADTDRWFRGASDQTTIPTVFIDEWSERGPGRFEPREDHKGNAARAVFYYRAVYPGQVTAYNSQSFFDTQADDLIDWHYLDPVDLEEYARSAWIATRQGTHNPFILDSTLARRAYTLTGSGEEGGATGPLWVNEIHYDNASTDADEGVEVAGPAGTSLSGWSLVFYNGNGGGAYATVALSGTVPSQQAGFGTVWVPVAGIQNGSPDGVALVAPDGTVEQFLSYEGTFTATDDAAIGLTSVDLGVAETTTTPLGHSLQVTGTGSAAEDFAWQDPTVSTPGQPNVGQTFVGAAPAVAWINELHYDNSSTDVDEGVEIAGTAGLDLSGWSVEFVNGSNGTVYATLPLSGTIDDEGLGLGALWFAQAGIQNGAPDGLALVDGDGALVQFLSYEGTLTASAGTASGVLSEDIGVSETGSTGATQSLQLIGSGETYADFTWTGPTGHSRGSLNGGQSSATVATSGEGLPNGGLRLDAQVFPNPTRGRTTLALDLGQAADVRADVFDALGRYVATVEAGRLGAGFQSVALDLTQAPTGLYVVRVQAGTQVVSRTLTVVR